LLYETALEFESTWIEALGDLSRYRMAIETENLEVRQTWVDVSRSWYIKATEKDPTVSQTRKLWHTFDTNKTRLVAYNIIWPYWKDRFPFAN
jgi:hypothetical protein